MFPGVAHAALAFHAERGGRRRRLSAREALVEETEPAAAAAAPSGVPGITSQLLTSLVQEWAWGKHSSIEIQRLCHKSYLDQKTLREKLKMSPDHIDRSLVAVARMGNFGKYPGNVHRELVAWLGDPTPPKPLTLEVPVKVAKPGRLATVRTVEQNILLPHVEFANLYANNRNIFDKYLLGQTGDSPDTVRSFWDSCLERDDPRLHDHEMRNRRGWKRHAVPLAIHGDGVACIAVGKPGTQSMDTVSWASVLSAGTTIGP